MRLQNPIAVRSLLIALVVSVVFSACGSKPQEGSPAHQTITKAAPVASQITPTPPAAKKEVVTPSETERLLNEVQTFRLLAGMTQVATQTEFVWHNLQQPDTPREKVDAFRDELLAGMTGAIDTMWILPPLYLVFNPLPWERKDIITLDVTELIAGEPFQNVQVHAWTNFLEPSQLRTLPGGRYELRFVSRDLPAWAWTTFRTAKDVQLAEDPPTTLSVDVQPDGLQVVKSSRLALGVSVTLQQILVRNEECQEDVLQPGITINWLDTNGQIIPFNPIRKIRYVDSGPAFIELLAIQRSPQGEFNTEMTLYDRLGYAEFSFSTNIASPSGTIVLDMPLAFDPQSGYSEVVYRGEGLFAVKGPASGMALFHDESARIELAENNTVRVELPFESGRARFALYPHSATETVSSLTRHALEYLYPVRVKPVDNHFGRLHSALTFLEWNGQKSEPIPIIRIEPENVLLENVNYTDQQDATFDLVELDGLATDVTLKFFAKSVAVNGEPVDATRTIRTTIGQHERKPMHVQFQTE